MLATAVVRDQWADLARAVAAAAVVSAITFAALLASPKAVGLGDVVLAALIGGMLAWISWTIVVQGLALGFAAATTASLMQRLAGRPDPHIPMAPYLIPAALITTAFI